MFLSQIKELKSNLDNLGVDDWREFIDRHQFDGEDFEIENYRFINEGDIDEVMQEELKNDTYILGCFNAHFLSSIIGLSVEIIIALQEGEKYEALGEHCLDHIEEIQEDYARADGYGHHFAHYDGNENTIEIDEFEEQDGRMVKIGVTTYYAFRIN